MSAAAEQQWLAAAAATIRRAHPDRTKGRSDAQVVAGLTRTTVEGLAVPPLAPSGPAARWVSTRAPAGAEPIAAQDAAPDDAPRIVDVRSVIFGADQPGADLLAEEVDGGANSLWLRGVRSDQLSALLARVDPSRTPLIGNSPALAAISDLHPHSNLGIDPIGETVVSGHPSPPRREVSAAVRQAAELAASRGIRALALDGMVAHQSGAGDAQELGYALACAAAYLRDLEAAGWSPGLGIGLLELRLAVTAEQFSAIAKLRAARELWRRLAELCGSDRAVALHAVSSPLMLTVGDPWVNVVRGSVAAWAAVVGGADAVTVLPMDAAIGAPDPAARRLARTSVLIPVLESGLADVTDPAAGSALLEYLTDEIADAAWAEFARIEAAGGVVAATADGSMPARWRRTRRTRFDRIASGEQRITGVTWFPPTDGARLRRPPGGWAAEHRWSAAAEAEAAGADT